MPPEKPSIAAHGLFIGDTKSCATAYNPLGGNFEEIGVELNQFSIFVRDYRITRAGLRVPTNIFFGLGYRF